MALTRYPPRRLVGSQSEVGLRMRTLLASVMGVAILLAGCGAQTPAPTGAPGGGGGGGAGPGALPPVGAVWFGTGFEPGSTNLVGKTATVKQGTPVVALGHFLATKAPEDMTVQIVLLGTTKARVPFPPGAPSTSFGIDLSDQKLAPGPYQVNFVDKNRRTVASGTLTVTP